MNNRIRYIDFEKTICIFIMLYIHLTFQYVRVVELSFLHRLCIPQFAFITGYNMHFTLNKNFFKTLAKIIYIYFISIFITQLVFNSYIDIKSALIYVLTGTIDMNVNIPLWYIPHHISLYTISFVILNLLHILTKIIKDRFKLENFFPYGTMVIVSILMAIIGFNYKSTNYFFIKQTLIMIPFVMVGYLVNMFDLKFNYVINNIDKKKKAVLLSVISCVFVVFLSIFIVLTLMDGMIDVFQFVFNNVFSFYISSICGVICLFIMSKIICSIFLFDIITEPISWIAKRSIYICCFSQPVSVIALPYYSPLIMNFEEGTMLNIIINIIMITICSIVLSCLFEK